MIIQNLYLKGEERAMNWKKLMAPGIVVPIVAGIVLVEVTEISSMVLVAVAALCAVVYAAIPATEQKGGESS